MYLKVPYVLQERVSKCNVQGKWENLVYKCENDSSLYG